MKFKTYSLLFLILFFLGCPISEEESPAIPDNPSDITWEVEGFVIKFNWTASESDYYRLYIKENNSWSVVQDYIAGSSLALVDFPYDTELNYGISSTLGEIESSITQIEAILVEKDNLFVTGIITESMVYSDSIGILFDPIPGNYKYHIYRDQTLLGTTQSTHYIDTTPVIDTVYNYSVAWENLITGDIGPISQGVEGAYSSSIDIEELVTELELTGEKEESLFKFNEVLDRDLYSLTVKADSGLYLSIAIPEEYGSANIYYEEKLIKSFPLPIENILIESDIDKILLLEVAATDRSDNFNVDYTVKLTNAPLQPPTNFSYKVHTQIVELSWESGMSCNLYRRESSGSWILIAPGITSSSFSDSTLTIGSGYYYGIATVVGDRESRLVESSVVKIPTDSIFVTGLNVKSLFIPDGILVSWNPLNSLYEYDIYRSNIPEVLGQKIGNTVDLNFTDYSSQGLLRDTIYYYRVIWKDDTNGISGAIPVVGTPGFYSDITDTREPFDNSRDSQVSENFTLGESSSTVLYKKSELIDRDWFYHSIPRLTSRYITGTGLNGKAIINIYRGNSLIRSVVFPFKDIELKNETSGDMDFYFEVLPIPGSSDFIESYTLTISDF